MSPVESRGPTIPVVLFAYARPHTLERTLACLRADAVPHIIAFSDGPRSAEQEAAISEVRAMLRAVDWCELELHGREENLGLGRSILIGVTEVFSRYEAAIVFEDDLICVPGTYRYLCAAMAAYWAHPRVMSVTGWTHPLITPAGVDGEPYFDGRAECWVWGTWARAWQGMERTALELVADCRARGLDVNRYGYDLQEMATVEQTRNIWAVRFLYLHIASGGLCLRPRHSMVEHIGYGEASSNAKFESVWRNPPLAPCSPLPARWPEPHEHPGCAPLWRRAFPPPPGPVGRLRILLGRIRHRLIIAGSRAAGGPHLQ